MNITWTTLFPRPLKVIHFKDLVQDTERTLREILEFLDIPVNEELMACTLVHKSGWHRRVKPKLNFDPFSEEDRILIAQKSEVAYKNINSRRS